ncbi:MAG: 1-acyl-sn-glycerol-3-phosphate acyltransferase [Planctomycetota bacterium]|nr:MAG: 1-acyl-sn-glycerol-3-phosphate acyltransferase [Planctomycetota bacterium]
MTPPVERSLAKRVWYDSLRVVCRMLFVVVFRMRARGREYLPAEGGGLVLSNHQSHLDPVIVGLTCDRRMNYVARTTLFRFAPFRWLINSLDAIPIDREGGGRAGLKETLKRVKRGELVLLFPEGTRTPDGEVHRIKPGFCYIARRANVPIFIVAFDGAYDAWPRDHKLPRRSVIHLQYAPPITTAEFEQMTDEQLVAEAERRIRWCHAEARRHRYIAMGKLEASDESINGDGPTQARSASEGTSSHPNPPEK